MEKEKNIVVTGAAGFIGSYMTGYLNSKGYENLILVDEFDEDEKELNLHGKKWLARVERDNLIEWLSTEKPLVNIVLHLGARTDTTEFDYSIHEKLNLEYSKDIWNYCTYNTIPLIYASSAATFGAGEFGYKDDHDIVEKLQPLNPYGISKNEFDKWVLRQVQDKQPPFWAGLKFFNVFGPNEYHKSRMASVIFHAFNQIQSTGEVKLFRSHKEGFKDGEQLRDFIYVEDVAKVMHWMMEEIAKRESTIVNKNSENHLTTHDSRLKPGLYNLGTGKARTFNDLACAIFKNLELHSQIEYIDTPADIRDKYQYFTEAVMDKLRAVGYNEKFYSLEDGIKDYVRHYLIEKRYY
jgi:ADP-L-glycero-D-manno-heptose 6-epimerase